MGTSCDALNRLGLVLLLETLVGQFDELVGVEAQLDWEEAVMVLNFL